MPKRHANAYASDDGFVAEDLSDPDTNKPSKRTKTSGNDKSHKQAKSSSASAAKAKQTDENGDEFWRLNASGNRRVTLNNFRGKMLVNIREYYEADGEMRPGKKGISMPVDQFAALIEVLPQLEASLKQKGESIPRPGYGLGSSGKATHAEEDEEDGDGGAHKAGKVRGSKKDGKEKLNYEATSDEDED